MNACYLLERYATINVHYLLQLTEAVADLGTRWTKTYFEFENANVTIKKLFHGTHKIDMQVINCIHVHILLVIKQIMESVATNSICQQQRIII